MAINDRFIFTGGGDGGIRQWPLETSAKRNYILLNRKTNNKSGVTLLFVITHEVI